MFSEIVQVVSNPYLIIIFLTFLPLLELRASIPYGILVAKLPWYEVFILAVIVNIIIGPVIYFCLDKIIHWFFFIKPFHVWYIKKVENAQTRIQSKIDKYGIVGIAIFIGVPLPGTGVYTGALASYALNLGYIRFLYATILGVLIAGIAVLTITLTLGATGNWISWLFLKFVT